MMEFTKTQKQVGFIGLAVSLLVGWECHLILNNRDHSIQDPRYLVAARFLKSGTPFSLRDFTFTMEKPVGEAEGLFTDQDLVLLQGSKLKEPLEEKGYLSKSKVSFPRFADS